MNDSARIFYIGCFGPRAAAPKSEANLRSGSVASSQ